MTQAGSFAFKQHKLSMKEVVLFQVHTFINLSRCIVCFPAYVPGLIRRIPELVGPVSAWD